MNGNFYAWAGWIIIVLSVAIANNQPLILFMGIGFGLLLKGYMIYSDEVDAKIEKVKQK